MWTRPDAHSGYTVYCCSSVHGIQASSTHTLVLLCIAARLCSAVRPRPHTLWLYSVLLFVCVRQSGLVHTHSGYTVYCCSSVYGSQASSTYTLVILCIAVRLCTAVRPCPHTIWLYSACLQFYNHKLNLYALVLHERTKYCL